MWPSSGMVTRDSGAPSTARTSFAVAPTLTDTNCSAVGSTRAGSCTAGTLTTGRLTVVVSLDADAASLRCRLDEPGAAAVDGDDVEPIDGVLLPPNVGVDIEIGRASCRERV